MELAANVALKVGAKAEITLYIALSERDALTVHREGYLDPKLFGSYIPLKLTKEDAVQAALEGPDKSAAMMAAVWSSRWHVIEIWLNSEQVAEFMLAKTLTHSTFRGQPAFQCTKILDLEHCTWTVIEIAPTGPEAWSDTHLPRHNFKGMSGRCNTCEGADLPPQYYNTCNACWHAFYLARAQRAAAREAEKAEEAAEADKDLHCDTKGAGSDDGRAVRAGASKSAGQSE